MRVVDSPKPAYSTDSEKKTLKATPVVKITVNEDGTVRTATLTRSSGIRSYDRAIVEAIEKWRYNEATGCGERLATITVTIEPGK